MIRAARPVALDQAITGKQRDAEDSGGGFQGKKVHGANFTLPPPSTSPVARNNSLWTLFKYFL